MSVPVPAEPLGALEAYIHKHIPISAAMGVTVESASFEEVRLRAPLDLNINHRSTAFGGSVAAVAILAGWTLLHVRIGHGGRGDRIVIQRNAIEYTHAIDEDFEAVAIGPAPADWHRFQTTLQRRGRARIDITTQLICRGEVAGECVGAYVILPTGADGQPACEESAR